MSMISFDALKLARRLREAGMPSEQAEAVAEAEAEALGEFVQSHLATNRDIAELKQEIGDCNSELKLEITAARGDLKQDIASVRQEITDCRSKLKQEIAEQIVRATRWNIGVMLTLVAAVLAILRLTG